MSGVRISPPRPLWFMKMILHIYKSSKTPTQSGDYEKSFWYAEYVSTKKKETDSLMGWMGSNETDEQIKLKFKSKQEAVYYAKKNKLEYFVEEARETKIKPKTYADNFR